MEGNCEDALRFERRSQQPSPGVFLPRQGSSAHGTSSFSFRAGDNREAGSHQARTDVGTLRGERNPKEASLLFSAGWR